MMRTILQAALVTILTASAALAQVTPEEARARLEAKAKAHATTAPSTQTSEDVLRRAVERLTAENEKLKAENADLKRKVAQADKVKAKEAAVKSDQPPVVGDTLATFNAYLDAQKGVVFHKTIREEANMKMVELATMRQGTGPIGSVASMTSSPHVFAVYVIEDGKITSIRH